jgi:hypothetical protein
MFLVILSGCGLEVPCYRRFRPRHLVQEHAGVPAAFGYIAYSDVVHLLTLLQHVDVV